MKCYVLDTTNSIVRVCNSIKEAKLYIQIKGRYDWSITVANKKSTDRQRAAVRFCEEVLNVEFLGNIELSIDCSWFLEHYLDYAKTVYDEIRCEYEAHLWSKD